MIKKFELSGAHCMFGRAAQLAFSLCVVAAYIHETARAESTSDPIQKIVGEWDVIGARTKIIISGNHYAWHSKWGLGDIKWDNAEYYLIKYRYRYLECS